MRKSPVEKAPIISPNSLQPSTFSLQPSSNSLQPSAFSLLPTAFSLQPSANSLYLVLKHFLETNRTIKFAYLFGSHARGDAGPLSDVDLAVYVDNRFDFFSLRLRLLEELSRQFKGQPCDLVVLNNASLVLQYEVIRDGKILKEDKQKRVQFETDVIRKYLDTSQIRSVHASSLKLSFIKEHRRDE